MEPMKRFLFLLFATGASAEALKTVLAAHNNTLSILNNFLSDQEELFEALSTAKNITVLAPNNDALNKLAEDTAMMDAMASEDGMVAAFLKYHVFHGTWYMSNFTTQAPTVVTTMMNDTSFTNVTGGQRAAGRIIDGTVNFISGYQNLASIHSGDFNFTGGTIHIMESVLTMPPSITNALISANLTAAAGALNKAGLAEDVTQDNEVTIFAPSNAAFNAVGSAISGLSKSELAALMGYHVVKGKVLYTAMMTNGTETTSAGNKVHIRMENGEIFVNSAKIVRPNLFTDNGVIHICDNVLNPENESATPNPTLATQSPAFSGAKSTNSVPFTSGVRTPTPTSAAVTTTVTAVAGPGGGSPATALAAPPLVGKGAGSCAMVAMVLLGGAAVCWNL